MVNSIEAAIAGIKDKNNDEIPEEYKIKNTSWRVLKLILGNTKLSNIWSGINL